MRIHGLTPEQQVYHEPGGAVYVGFARHAFGPFSACGSHVHLWPPDDRFDLHDENGNPLERCSLCGLIRQKTDSQEQTETQESTEPTLLKETSQPTEPGEATETNIPTALLGVRGGIEL